MPSERIERLNISDLPETARALLEGRQPDLPRIPSLPWALIGALGAIVVSVTAALMTSGLGAFSSRDEWAPLLVVVLVVVLPSTYVLVRDWRRNRAGGGRQLGVYFATGVTFWRDSLTKVWSIPDHSLQSIHLTLVRLKRGPVPDRLVIRDADGQTVEIIDVSPPLLWHRLRALHPGATATYEPGLESQLSTTTQRPASSVGRSAAPAAEPTPPRPADAQTRSTSVSKAWTVLTGVPDVAPPPAPPASFNGEDVHTYVRALLNSQDLIVRWLSEQPTGETPVYIKRSLIVQWKTLAPIADAIASPVKEGLDQAIAEGRAAEWISLHQLELHDWTHIRVDE